MEQKVMVAQGFSFPRRSREPDTVKVMTATWPKPYEERPLTVRTLTRFLGIPDKRETQLCIFPTSK